MSPARVIVGEEQRARLSFERVVVGEGQRVRASFASAAVCPTANAAHAVNINSIWRALESRVMFIPLCFRPDTKASTAPRSKPAQVLLGRASAVPAAAARECGLGA